VHLAKYSYGEQIKEDEMGGKCGTQGISEKCIQFCLESLTERYFLEDLRVDGMLILTLWRRNFLLNFSTPVFKM
jgi:hypothetical protein